MVKAAIITAIYIRSHNNTPISLLSVVIHPFTFYDTDRVTVTQQLADMRLFRIDETAVGESRPAVLYKVSK